jgi:hypothetical protein
MGADIAILRDKASAVIIKDRPAVTVIQSGLTADFGRVLRTITGESFPEIDKTDFIAQYWVGDAVGNPIPSVGTVTGGDATLRTDLANPAAGGNIVGYKASGTGAVAQTISDKLGERISVLDYGAVDGAADNTAAFNAAHTAALAAGKRVFWPAGTWIVSTLSLAAGLKIDTAGLATLIKQKSGTATNTRVISIAGSNVEIGSLSIEGQLNQAGDTTGEQNHGILIQGTATNGDLSNIKIGNVVATNVRGDAVYVGAQAGHTAAYVVVGNVICKNVYRNGVTIAGGASNVTVGDVDGRTAGLFAIDLEPNSGEGDSVGIRFGRVQGRAAQGSANGQTITDVYFLGVDLDPSNAGSTPAYPFTIINGMVVRGVEMKGAKLKLNGFSSSAMTWASGGTITPIVDFDRVEITNCCGTSTTAGFLAGGAEYRFGSFKTITTNASHSVFVGVTNAKVGKADVQLLTASRYMNACTDCATDELTVAKPSGDAGNGGLVFSNCTRAKAYGGSAVADRLFSGGNGGRAVDMVLTLVTGVAVGTTGNSRVIGCAVNGVAWEILSYSGTTVIASIDGTGAAVFTASLSVTGGGWVNAAEYRVAGGKVIGARKSGWTVPTGTLSRAALNPATSTLAQAIQTLNALINDLHSAGVGSTHAQLTS